MKTKQQWEHFQSLREGMVNVKTPPKFYAIATEVVLIKQNQRGIVELTYENGTKEKAKLPYDIVEEESFFKIVGDVQGRRKQ